MAAMMLGRASGSGSDVSLRRTVRSLSDGSASLTPPTSPGAVAQDVRLAKPSSFGVLLRRPWALVAVVLTAVMVPVLYGLQQPELVLLTPEAVSNHTFRTNKFFKDQLLFSNTALLANLSAVFTGRYYVPGEILAARDDIPRLFIIENGSAHVVPLDDEDRFQFKDPYRHGDAFGGMHILYSKPCEHSVEAGSTGVFAWVADTPRLLEILNNDLLVMAALERKFVRSLVEKRSKRPILFFPGFASTQLIAWKAKKCVGTTIEVGDRVWLDIQKVLHHNIFEEQCWIKCMSLDILEQTDPVDCKLRPQEGMSAIYDLAGGIFAPFTTIFRTIVFEMADQFGYDISSMRALPYDWRLAPMKLQERDQYFSHVRQEIEHVVKLNRNPSISICHSMGCNVFEYFLKWMEKTEPAWEAWMDKHIWMYIAVAAPLLGSAQTVKGMLSGIGFSLPIDPADARLMGVSFSSNHWIAPHNINVSTALQHKFGSKIAPFSKWHPKIVTILLDDDDSNVNATFDVPDVTSGKLFGDIGPGWEPQTLVDPDFDTFNQSLHRYYHSDPIYNPLAANTEGPSRPRIRKILAIYGVNVHTDIGYTYRVGTVHNKAGLKLEEERYEAPGGKVVTKSTKMLSNFKPTDELTGYNKSGDGVVPYASLSWINSWHYDNLNVTAVPANRRVDLDALLSQFGENLSDIDVTGLLNSVNTLEPAYTKYASSQTDEGGDTQEMTVIEVDSVSHRSVIKDLFVVERLQDEMYWLVRKEFLRGRPLSRDQSVPVNRITQFFSTVTEKFWEVLYKDRASGADDVSHAAPAEAGAATTAI